MTLRIPILHVAMRLARVALNIVAIASLPGALAGQAAPARATAPVTLARLTSAIELDGFSNEPAWAAIAPVTPAMLLPTFEGTPSQRTEFRFAHDDEFLYASARMLVNDSAQIRGNSLQRDRLGSDDVFRVILDTFNDSENGVGFATTPTGVRVDFSVSGDGQVVNYDWNTYWEVATARTDSGWFAEMRIPLSSLRFQSVGGATVMGLLAMRSSSATNETVSYPAVSPRFANPSMRVSQGLKLVLEGVLPPRRDVRVAPFLLGGGTRSATRTEGSPFFHRSTGIREAGLDVKYGITSNLTLDLTANTDFAQAEVDDQQVNLSRFSLFFPEKRQFFLERAGVFEFSTGGIGDPSRIFHSRQIGLTAQGLPVRILAGARMVGRIGGWDIAALDMQTEAARPLAAENFGVVRIRRRVLNEASTIGGILTSRMSEGGQRNHVYGTDATLRVRRNDYLNLQWAQSFDDERPASGGRAGSARVSLERRASQGLVYRIGARWSGPDYDPELGFQTRRDFTHYEGNVRYGWYPGARTIFQNIQPSLVATTFLRNSDGVAETVQASSFLNFSLKNGVGGFLFHGRSSEMLSRPLQLAPDAVVPAGRHTFGSTSVTVFSRSGARVRTGVTVGRGQFYDGNQVTASFSPTATLSQNLEVGTDYQLNRIHFPARSQSLSADIARLRMQAALNTRLSASGFVQYNRAADAVVSNVRIRIHMNEGRDLFVVYNEHLNTERATLDPMPPFSQERALLVKLVYAFSP